jgi:hypothetical protein
MQSHDRAAYAQRHVDSDRSNGRAEDACLDSALTRQEDQFLSTPGAVDRAEITGDTLVLSKGGERLAMMMR